MVAIRSTKLAHDGWLKLRVATLSGDDGVEFTREIEDHGAAVAILPYDPERRVALLVKLPRAPVLLMGETVGLPRSPRRDPRSTTRIPAACARREADGRGRRRRSTCPGGGRPHLVDVRRLDRAHAPVPGALRGSGKGPRRAAASPRNTRTSPSWKCRWRIYATWRSVTSLDDMKTLCLVQTLRLRRPELFA